MGQEVVSRLRAAGHVALTVDLHDADVVADLSAPAGRREAAGRILELANGHLNGVVLAAGLGPHPGREELIAQVNYLAPTELLLAWRSALAVAAVEDGISSKVVVFGSNSSTVTPGIPASLVRSFLDDKPATRTRVMKLFGRNAPAFAYGGSKLALSRWVRRTAVTPEWAGSGIRLNVIAPGAIMTPLLQGQLEGPDHKRIEAFPIPVGGYGDAGQIADWVLFMLSPAADFMCGSVVFVDGGSDAYFRADDWPRGVPLRRVAGYLRRMRAFTPQV
jgi:NAD(P)-dependent dehydrogenase (short-subunit alcohol dehydrogenase family)